MNESIFRTRLVMLRKEHHLTQGQIAEKLGLSRPSYTCYELGNSIPTVYTLCKLADMFEVNLDYLLGRSENPAIGAGDPKDTEAEIHMIETFRKLSPEKREKFCDMLGLFVE